MNVIDLILRMDRLLENADLKARRHVNEVLLRRSSIYPLSLHEGMGYGHWISPDGELIPVPTMGHAKKAEQLRAKTGISPDLAYSTEDQWRIPYVKAGWVRTVTRGSRLTIQGMYFPAQVASVVRELVRGWGKESLIENLTTKDVVMILPETPRFQWERELRDFFAKSPKMPTVRRRQAESVMLGSLSVSEQP